MKKKLQELLQRLYDQESSAISASDTEFERAIHIEKRNGYVNVAVQMNVKIELR